MNLLRMSFGGAALAVFLAFPVFAQDTSATEKVSPEGRGIVVEQLDTHSESEKAGLAPGDVLTGWKRGDRNGAIGSPFDLAIVELEQAPRGTVTIEGIRGDRHHNWELGLDGWGIQTRPNFSAPMLGVYREGLTKKAVGDVTAAVNNWSRIDEMASGQDVVWLQTWIRLRIAQTLAEARQWQEADKAYRKAIDASISAPQEVQRQILRSWEKTFVQRSDWNQAEQLSTSLLAGWDGQSLAGTFDIEARGDIAYSRGRMAEAKTYYQRALEVRTRVAPGSLLVAASLNNLAKAADDLSDYEKAEEYSRRAAEITAALAPTGAQAAISLNNLGDVAYDRGKLDLAEKYYAQSLQISTNLAPESLAVARSLNDLGLVATQRGDLSRAENYLTQALSIRRRLATDTLEVARSLNNLGQLMHWRGDLLDAEENLLQALAIKKRLAPESLSTATSLNNLGVVIWQRGDLSRAEEYHLAALAIREKQSPNGFDVAMSLNNLVLIELERGDLTKAEMLSERGLAIYQKLAPDSLSVAIGLSNLGLVAHRRGQLAAAHNFYEQALNIRKRLAPTSVDLALNLNRLGSVAIELKDLDGAERYYAQASPVWEKLAPESAYQADAFAGLAAVMSERGRFDLAEHFYQQAVNALEGQNRRLGGTEETRAGFRAKYEVYYQEYAALLVSQGKTDAAFDVLERSRGRSLLEMLASAHVNIRQGADGALLNQEQSLRAELSAKSERRMRLLSDKPSDEQVAEIDKDIGILRDQYESIEAQIRATSRGYAALTQPHPVTAEAMRRSLDANTAVLEYSLGEHHSYVFTVTPESIVAHELSSRDQIESLARRVYENLTARNRRTGKGQYAAQRGTRLAQTDRNYGELSQQLSQLVLGPVAAEIKGRRLVVVSDGALQYIPFGALPDPNSVSAEPLITGHEIVNLPTASVLAVLRNQEKERERAPKTVAVLADPIFNTSDQRLSSRERHPSESQGAVVVGTGAVSEPFSQDLLTRSVRDVGLLELSRLPYTRREADAIISFAPAGQVKEALGFDATRATAIGRELSQYRIVHFATHGLLDSQHPELSGLVLSLVDRDGTPQAGFLGLEDIYNLDLPVDLVVLSACETGLGKEISGEGLIGLTRGFMYAGASRVVASLWKVSDVATAELMRLFYQAMLRDHLPPAAALRRAQTRMQKTSRWKSPYYWAAFQLQGDWK